MKVVSGSLDVLETVGRKTFDVSSNFLINENLLINEKKKKRFEGNQRGRSRIERRTTFINEENGTDVV